MAESSGTLSPSGGGVGVGARRHQRQRSSVSVKKRISKADNDEAPDNALSAPNPATTPTHSSSVGSLGESPFPSISSTLHVQETKDVRPPPRDPTSTKKLLPSPKEDGEEAENRASMDGDYFSTSAPFFPSKVLSSPERRQSAMPAAASPPRAKEEEGVSNGAEAKVGDESVGAPDVATTRTELDLFDDDDDDNTISAGPVPTHAEAQRKASLPPSSAPVVAPALPPKDDKNESESAPSVPQKPLQRSNSSSTSSATASPVITGYTTPRSGRTMGSPSSSIGRVSGGQRRLSLLTGGGPPSSSSSVDSAYGVRAYSSRPSDRSASPSTPTVSRRTSILGSKRMSLAYIPSPATSTTRPFGQGDLGPTTPSSSSSLGYVGSRGTSTPKTGPTPTSVDSAQSPSALGARRKEDGDTVMTQHKDMLARIAEKERRCLEMREALTKEEDDLRELRREWQASVHRELANESVTTSPTALRNKGALARAASSSISSMSSMPSHEEEGMHTRDNSLSTTTAPTTAPSTSDNGSLSSSEAKMASLDGSTQTTSDKLKDLGKRLPSGWGVQLNNFLDQLAAAPGSDKDKDREALAMGAGGSDVAAAAAVQDVGRQGLEVLAEEDEGSSPRAGSARSKPLPPVGFQRPPPEQRHNKRQSVFGTLASFQKSVEEGLLGLPPRSAAVSSPPNNDAAHNDTNSESNATAKDEVAGWGTWQKRLKEARENASGLLAKAEATLGRAMTIDELIAIEPGRVDQQNATSRAGAATSTGGGAFDEANEREKAALAELSWLKSLSPAMRQSGNDGGLQPTKDETQTTRLDPETLLELEKGSGLAPLSGLGLGLGPGKGGGAGSQRRTSTSSANSNSSNQTATAKKRMSGSMPIASPSGGGDSSLGFMSMLSSAWGTGGGTTSVDGGRRPSLSPKFTSSSLHSDGGVSPGEGSTGHRRTPSNQSKTRLAARMAAAAGAGSAPSNSSGGAGKSKATMNGSGGTHAKTNNNNNNWDWDAPLSQAESKRLVTSPPTKSSEQLDKGTKDGDKRDDDDWGW